VLHDPVTGRTLEVRTDQPGLQVYSGGHLDGTVVGLGGRVYAPRSALCLETEHLPDSPNRPEYPSTVLRPGEQLRTSTVWVFSA
jgi:aldose 1-epimerase